MDFGAVFARVREQPAREKRAAYHILKRRYQLTDEDIEDLKADLKLETPMEYFDRAITPNEAFVVRYHIMPIP